ncbi:MAG: M56 family metallopeptidase, partial [Bacteroidota bacterium]
MFWIIPVLLKASLILAISSLLLLAQRPLRALGIQLSASFRHWIISLSFIGLLVLPMLMPLLPDWQVEVPGPIVLPTPKNTTTITELHSITDDSAPMVELPTQSTSTAIPTVSKSTSTSFSWSSYLLLFLLGLWISVALVLVVKLALGVRKLLIIRQKASKFQHSSLSANVSPVSILSHPEVRTPMTFGFRQPVVLLPEEATNWDATTLQTILLHELAHIQRKDYWVHVLSLISAAIYWFHPLVWWMKKQQLIEREKACDEFVLKAGLSAQQYAEQLVYVARHLFHQDSNPQDQCRDLQTYALPMAQVSELKGRLYAILNFRKEKFGFGKIRQWQWASFYVSVIVLLSAFTPVEKTAFAKQLVDQLPVLPMAS